MIQQSILLETLATVRKRIQQIRERKETIGEENTKATLIEPVFSALGWNLQEMDEVRREYRQKPQDNPVDYALILNRTECLFVEAKSLEKDLGDHKWVMQNLTYATGAGVQWCVLSNGDEYRIYNAHAPVAAEERLFRSVRISEAESKFLTDTLLLLSKDMMRGSLLDELWKAHFVDRNVRLALESMLAQPDRGLERLVQKKASALSKTDIRDIRASLKRAKIDFPAPSTSASASKGACAQGAETKRRATPGHEADMKAMADVTLEKLIAAGLIRAPLDLEREYKGVHVSAVIGHNGKVVFAGEAYDSLSTAAGMARKSVIGARRTARILRRMAGSSGNTAMKKAGCSRSRFFAGDSWSRPKQRAFEEAAQRHGDLHSAPVPSQPQMEERIVKRYRGHNVRQVCVERVAIFR